MNIIKIGFLLLLLSIGSGAIAAPKKSLLHGQDSLNLPTDKIFLRLKAERAGLIIFRRDIRNAKVEYFSGPDKLGEGTTGKNGVSVFPIKELPIGTHQFTAQFKNKKKFSALPAKITVTVISANRPVAISDIDHTISNMGAKDFLFRPIEEIPTLPNAVEGIESLALNHQVVYLTARDDTFTSKTDRWMEYNQFVAGPVYFWDFGFGNGVPGNHGEYKSGVIARMKKKFNKVLIGVGDKPHDVAAYREHGLRAYYIGKNLEEPLPSGTIIIKSWDAITAHLKKNPIGSLAGDPTP